MTAIINDKSITDNLILDKKYNLGDVYTDGDITGIVVNFNYKYKELIVQEEDDDNRGSGRLHYVYNPYVEDLEETQNIDLFFDGGGI